MERKENSDRNLQIEITIPFVPLRFYFVSVKA